MHAMRPKKSIIAARTVLADGVLGAFAHLQSVADHAVAMRRVAGLVGDSLHAPHVVRDGVVREQNRQRALANTSTRTPATRCYCRLAALPWVWARTFENQLHPITLTPAECIAAGARPALGMGIPIGTGMGMIFHPKEVIYSMLQGA